mmetsp:Transcript_2268/g.3150  ORF Transcript_2268/g.3150 Transcript_2268/m.3150 type:complete len:287 (-) Transcript_2268:415-1275(-)|eukprot:CAMPEP_0117751022 /NCGR_PEP_ID=MMETSP0947-20121206/10720_1 /TAXON_ID=44440 /ORGANISM="Chattonella subsalsa, Strain CCMP2191" /LENGTH=286 /DNA_ID=CAMNT_0005569309 /DNA_START=118 /DNA_END=978 /DNA_ORIENTATION=+
MIQFHLLVNFVTIIIIAIISILIEISPIVDAFLQNHDSISLAAKSPSNFLNPESTKLYFWKGAISFLDEFSSTEIIENWIDTSTTSNLVSQTAKNTVLVQRELDEEMKKEVDSICENMDSFKFEVVHIKDSNLLLNEDAIGKSSLLRSELLLKDIKEVCEWFCSTVGRETIDCRLVLSDQVPCPRLHVDKVHSRLICTYSGPGTEWLQNDDILWGNIQKYKDEADHLKFNTMVMKENATVFSSQEGELLLLRGTKWAGFSKRPAVHKSPVVNDSQRRLVLILTSHD